jgi:hypothetical protein
VPGSGAHRPDTLALPGPPQNARGRILKVQPQADGPSRDGQARKPRPSERPHRIGLRPKKLLQSRNSDRARAQGSVAIVCDNMSRVPTTATSFLPSLGSATSRDSPTSTWLSLKDRGGRGLGTSSPRRPTSHCIAPLHCLKSGCSLDSCAPVPKTPLVAVPRPRERTSECGSQSRSLAH